ncbi:2960_t:CDS:2, partial [Racocetra persica]
FLLPSSAFTIWRYKLRKSTNSGLFSPVGTELDCVIIFSVESKFSVVNSSINFFRFVEQTYSSTSNKIGVYEFLEALGLLDNKFELDADNDSDEFWLCFGEDALKKLYRDQEAHQHFILLRLFTMCLSNLSEQAKNGLFVTFSRSNSFEVLEHNALLDAIAHPVKGLNLFKYDELG